MSSLSEINKTLQEQKTELQDVSGSLKNLVKAAAEQQLASRRESQNLKEDRQEAKRKAAASSAPNRGFVTGIGQGVTGTTGLDWLSNFARSAVGGLFGASSLVALTSTIGRLVGRAGFWGGTALVISQFGESLLTGLFDQIGVDDVIGEGTAREFAGSLSSALAWGSIGAIFGKRMGLVLLGGSLLGDLIGQRLLGLSDAELGEPFIDGFMENWLTNDVALTIGSTLALAFGPSLFTRLFRHAIGGRAAAAAAANASLALTPAMRTKLTGRFVARAGIGAAVGIFGGLLGDALSDATGSEEFGGAISSAANAAAVGMLFGPQAAIALAVASLGVSALSALGGWLRDRDQQVRDRVYTALEPYEDIADSDLRNFSEEEAAAAREAAVDALVTAERDAELLRLSPEAQLRAAEARVAAERILRSLPISSEGIRPDQIADVLQQSASGEVGRMDEFLRYMSGSGFSWGEDMLEGLQAQVNRLDLSEEERARILSVARERMAAIGQTQGDTRWAYNWFGRMSNDLLPPLPVDDQADQLEAYLGAQLSSATQARSMELMSGSLPSQYGYMTEMIARSQQETAAAISDLAGAISSQGGGGTTPNFIPVPVPVDRRDMFTLEQY